MSRRLGRAPSPSLSGIVREVFDGVSTQPLKSGMTIVGVALAASAVVTVVALAASGRSAVAEVLEATGDPYVAVRVHEGQGATRIDVEDVERAASAVAASSVAALSGIQGIDARTNPADTSVASPVTIRGVSNDPVEALGIVDMEGRSIDQGHIDRGDRVVMVGRGAATRLGLPSFDGQSTLLLDGLPFLIIGAFSEVEADATVGFDLLVPHTTAERDFGSEGFDTVYVRTDSPSVGVVAQRVAAELRPNAPQELTVSYTQADPRVQIQVASELSALTSWLLILAAVVSTAIIAVFMWSSITARTVEIGLRRAVGASSMNIAVQFLGEGVVLGALGAGLGLALGAAAVGVAASVRGWEVVVPAGVPLWVAAGGPVIAVLASLGPAIHAARLAPSTTLAR